MSAIRYAMFVKTVELQSLALAAGELCCSQKDSRRFPKFF